MKRLSLRGKVLGVLLPGVLVLIGAELWLTRLDAIDAANAAFDRSLSGAIRAVDLNVSTASGGLAVELPYRLFEFFQLTAHGTVYFRVATADGLVEIGTPDLPRPVPLPTVGTPVFHDAIYLGEPVRVGTYVRQLDRPLSPGGVQQLVVQLAESVASRRAFIRSFVLRAALRDALVISLVGVALALLLSWLLRPVSRLAAQVAARQPSDLRPLEAPELPRDIQPLVEAINQQLRRTQGLMESQRQFLDDASHQLRTPLATLHAQVGYALRLPEGEPALREALRSVAGQLEHATRGTNQLLALARGEALSLRPAPFDLAELVREVATSLLPLARAKGLDFGVELPEEATAERMAEGDRALLFEAASNLAHNAVHHTAAGGQVTLQVQVDTVSFAIQVLNTGPPLPEEVSRRLGERFVKGRGEGGAGLGLAIAKTLVERHGGTLRYMRLPDEVNCVSLHWPRPAVSAPQEGT